VIDGDVVINRGNEGVWVRVSETLSRKKEPYLRD
jgi:hypothetical protein